MQSFSYIARNRSGRITRGHLTASTAVELRSLLNGMELQLISLQIENRGLKRLRLKNIHPKNWLPVQSRDIELFLHQLAIMSRSGMKLLDSLKSLQLQSERKSMAKLLESIHDAVSQGMSLSSALAQHPVIPLIVVQLTEVGEQTGNLERVLTQAREYLADRRTTISEVRIALAYPAMVTTSALAISAYLVIFVIPQLQTFLSAMGRKLPAMTQSLVDLANWLTLYGQNLVIGGAGIAALLIATLYWPRGRLWLDRKLLSLPIVGPILRLSGTAGLTSSMAVMLQSGVRIVEAVKVSSRLQGNSYLANLLQKATRSIASGQPLAPALSTQGGFWPILGSMVEIAERSGNLDGTLSEVATFCSAELKVRIKRMTQMLEPAVIVIAGSIVGYVYIAFFVGLMSAGGNIK